MAGTEGGGRLPGIARGEPLRFDFEGRQIAAYRGETVAAALLAAGVRGLRAAGAGDTRGLFCGMGICFECRMVIDGRPEQRACMTPVAPGMRVARGTSVP